MPFLGTGHRRRGSGISTDKLSDLERAMVLRRHQGRDWYVNSSAVAGGAGDSWDGAVTTIAAAYALAAVGDVIHVAPGHAESVANATTIVPNKAGITLLGYGRGARRPTITLTHANGNIPVSGAGTRIENFLITTSGTIDVTSAITVTGADVELVDIELRDSAATSQVITGITLSTGAARARIERYVHRSHASGDALVAGISCAVALDGVEIIDVLIDGLASEGCIYNVTNAMTNLIIANAVLRNRHATKDGGIVLVATTTGFILSPRVRTATDDADGFNLAIVGADMQVYDPLVCNADGERAGAWGTASAA